jgi:hypothetical protein
MPTDDELPSSRLLHEVRAALTLLNGVQVIDLPEGEQPLPEQPAFFEIMSIQEQTPVFGRATPGSLPMMSDVVRMIVLMYEEIKTREIPWESTLPPYFASTEPPFVFFVFTNYTFAITVSVPPGADTFTPATLAIHVNVSNEAI